jgi:hypothetical protein
MVGSPFLSVRMKERGLLNGIIRQVPQPTEEDYFKYFD